jgi:hypothetical protein
VRFSVVGSMPRTRQAACPRVNIFVLIDAVAFPEPQKPEE